MDEFLVFLFTGFLEAGKTKFIQETLEDPRFNQGQNLVLLLCEEGIEEYDISSLAFQNVFIETVENEEDLTPEFLSSIQQKHNADQMIVEYNGMWMVQTLYDAMPENWFIAQEFMFADSTTFLNYNANMRTFVFDKLQSAELVVFNRFKPEYDKMEFHKIVKAVSRRADIAYEYDDHRVEYDDIEDPLPFDFDAPVIEIEDDDYALWYRDISEDPKKYSGKTVKFKGLTIVNNRMPPLCFAIGRQVMTCCVEDIKYHGVLCELIGINFKMPPNNAWITVTAKISYRYHKAYGRKGIVLTINEMEKAEPPAQEVATFY